MGLMLVFSSRGVVGQRTVGPPPLRSLWASIVHRLQYYDTTPDQVIQWAADGAGYSVESLKESYLVIYTTERLVHSTSLRLRESLALAFMPGYGAVLIRHPDDLTTPYRGWHWETVGRLPDVAPLMDIKPWTGGLDSDAL